MDFSTIILILQTVIEFSVNYFKTFKKVKFKFHYKSFLGFVSIFLLPLSIGLYFVYIFDLGVRYSLLLLEGSNCTSLQSKMLLITAYYVGFNTRRVVVFIKGIKTKDAYWAYNYIGDIALGVFFCIVVSFVSIYLWCS